MKTTDQPPAAPKPPQSQHTPGPWVVRGSSNPGNGTNWRDIVSLGGEFNPSYVGEAQAEDAAIIAAAPDLLAALEGAAQALARALPFLPADTEAHFAGEWLGEVREAIRQAKGDQ